jgi:hypothetical protein
MPIPVSSARTQGAAAPSAQVSTIVDGVPARDAGPVPLLRVQKEGRTDQAGTATFAALPAGFYTINVMPPPAFVRGQSPPPAQLTEGANAKTVVQLDRGGVITGRVFDEDGEPVTGARISVFRQEKTAGAMRTASFGSAQTTNDLGQFRVWALPEGDYIVSALFSEYSMIPGEDSGLREGPLPTFYPGVAASDGARPVVVKVGQETGGVDFPLAHGRLGTVSGRATDSAGNPLSSAGGLSANVGLSSRSQNLGFTGRSATVRPDGSFVIPGVPPGDYYLSATRMRPDQPNAPREGAYVPLSVNGDEVTVNIQTNLGATISGHVVVEGTPPAAQPGAKGPESRATPARVGLVPVATGGFGMAFASPSPSAVRPDGTFEVSGVRGVVQITAQGGSAALESVTRGGRDISGQPLELVGTERIDDIVVVMTEATGRIDGVVSDARGEPVSGAPVLIFPDNPARWSPNSPFVRQTRSVVAGSRGVTQAAPPGAGPGAAPSTLLMPGAFTLSLLAEGRYAIVALPASTSSVQPDRESLERWRALATVVTVEAGQTVAVTLTPIK